LHETLHASRGGAGEFSRTSKLAEERFIRRRAAKASAATGKELKALSFGFINFTPYASAATGKELKDRYYLQYCWQKPSQGSNWERIERLVTAFRKLARSTALQQLGKN
jgi:hypothetical protein